MTRDVFLCHAGEDKRDVVRPLYDALCAAGITCWLDEAEIHWGDDIVDRAQEGLRESRFVIVVLSATFLAKPWPRQELSSALSLELSSRDVRVLPLLVGGEQERQNILTALPLLSGKLHLSWEGDPAGVIKAMRRRLDLRVATPPGAHDVKEADETISIYCRRCGARIGKETRCPGYASHEFVQGTGREFCKRCGAKTGNEIKCPGYAFHEFIQGTGKEFCKRCGAKTGNETKCPGYAFHEFIQGTDR
jgi:hypothetical protein